MLKVRDFFRNSMSWKFLEHDFDVDKTIGSTVNEKDWRFDVSGGKFGDFVVSISSPNAQWCLHVIIVHLEALVPDDLEPVHNALYTCV